MLDTGCWMDPEYSLYLYLSEFGFSKKLQIPNPKFQIRQL